MIIPGLIVLSRAPRLAHRTASAITRNEFPRLESLVLLGRQRREPVTRLRRDNNARAAAPDDVAELFEHERSAIQVNSQNRSWRRLSWGDTGSMDDSGDSADRRGCLDELTD